MEAGAAARSLDVADAHARTAADLASALATAENGLTAAEAAARVERYGPNVLRVGRPRSVLRIIADQAKSVVIALLFAAAAVSFATGDPIEAAAILVVLLINIGLGTATELRARRAMDALLRLDVPRARVVRDGEVTDIDAQTLVPGDVIVLEAGQTVAADARLIVSAELRTSESALTGESLPVTKRADDVLPPDTTLADRTNSIYKSTSVVAGTGRALVFATGMDTEVGRIGGLVSGIADERTPLERRMDTLGRRLVWVTLLAAAAVTAMGVLRGEPLAIMLETGIALAIAAVPEGLPAVITIALAVGISRMARRRALVRRLTAVESLGSATVICTDKTGTLTAGEQTVTEMRVGGSTVTLGGTGYAPAGDVSVEGRPLEAREHADVLLALTIGALANDATVRKENGVWTPAGDPTDAALLVAARKAGLEREVLLERWPQIGQVPFSSERQLMATFHTRAGVTTAFAKGGPGRMLALCSRVLVHGEERVLDDGMRERLHEENVALAARGLRVLALATAEVAGTDADALRDMLFVGHAAMIDPAAPGVKETVARFREAGIRTVMLTGDQRLTAEAIARDLGVLGPDERVVEGRELEAAHDDALPALTERAGAFSRVSPVAKLRLVDAFQSRGQIVAMLGDGVNDAAALKKADVGVAMGIRGTDVAKEAADVVLSDDRFETVGAAIEEGRVIYDNIRKFVFYLFSCNLAEVLLLFATSLLGLPVPLSPLQLLWLNIVTDTFPALSLALEPAEPDIMRRPPRDPQEAILSRAFVSRIGFYAMLITAVTLAAFIYVLATDEGGTARAITFAFMTLALAQLFHLGNARSRSTVLSRHAIGGNRWAIGAVALVLVLQLAAVYIPPLAALLHLVPLQPRDWLVILPLAVLPAIIGQLLKLRQVA